MRTCKRGHEAERNPCEKCHRLLQSRFARTPSGRATSSRYARSPKGIARRRAHGRRNYLRHAERKRARMRLYYANNKQAVLARITARRARFGTSRNQMFWIVQERNSL
jgi:hypothetical protein